MNFLEDYILASKGCCLLEFLHLLQPPKLSFQMVTVLVRLYPTRAIFVRKLELLHFDQWVRKREL